MKYDTFRMKISECINAFDIMALTYKYLLELDDSEKYNITSLDEDIIKEIIDEYHQNNYFDHINSILNLEKKILEVNDGKITPNMMYNLLKHLDLSVDVNIEMNLSPKSIKNYTFLNFNYDDIGIFICHNSEFNILKEANGLNIFRKSIGNNIHNFYDSKKVIFLKEEQLFDFNLKILTLKKDNTISKNLLSEHTLNVALSPFICNHYEDFLEFDNNNYFFWFKNALGYGAEDDYADRYFKILDKSLHSNAQIIMFPEIILTEKIYEKLSKHIQEAKIVENKIIIAGTISRYGDNRCIVYDNHGKELFAQYKKTSFSLKMKDGRILQEKINKNNNINILDIQNLGRIFIFICKDLNNANLNHLLTSLKGNFIFVPAYSPSDDIISRGKSLSSEQLCFVFIINSCSAFNESKEKCDNFVKENIKCRRDIGTVIMPGIEGMSTREKAVFRLSLNQKCYNCEKICSPYLVTIKFDEFEKINNLYTCKMVEQRI